MSLAAVAPWLWLTERVKLAELVRTELVLVQLVITAIAELRFVTPQFLPFILDMPFGLFCTVINVGLEYFAVGVVIF